jgi:hypothetical protein
MFRCSSIPNVARSAALAIAAFVILLWGAIVPTLAHAGPFDTEGKDWEGLSELVAVAQAELGTQRLIVTSSLALNDLKREDGLLVVHPTRPLDVDELSAFMQAGGRVILLDDYGTGDELLTRFGIRRVPMPAKPVQMLRNNPSLALAEPAGAHSTVRDVTHVVTNHATGLEHAALSPLLVVRGDGEPDVLVALAGAVGHGRLIAVGDASIPMNSMMRYPGNRALARALVRYATDDDVWGKRGGTLYLAVNDFRTSGAFGGSAGVGGTLRRAVVDGLATLRREGLPSSVSYLGALIVALGVVVWTGARVGRTHRPSPPRFVRPVPAARQGGIAGHAAALVSAKGSRALALAELKSALEECVATRLGLERSAPRDELVGRALSAGLLDSESANAMSRLLAELERVEAFAGPLPARGPVALAPFERVRDEQVMAASMRVHELLDKLARAP